METSSVLTAFDPLQLVLRILQFSGSLPIKSSGSLLYKCFSYVVGFFLCTHVFYQWYAAFQSDISTDQRSLVICIALSTTSMSTKFIILKINGEVFREISRKIDSLPATPLDSACRRHCCWLCIIFLITGYSSAIAMILEPIISGHRTLVLPLKLPFDVEDKESYNYTVAYVGQSIIVIFMASIHFSTDALCFFIIKIICTHLQDISMKIEFSKINFSNPPRKNGNSYLARKQFHNTISEYVISLRIKECIKRHQSIIRIADLLESSMNYIIFVQSFSCMFVGCFTSYQMTMHPDDVSTLTKLAIYMTAVMTELLVYCWYGTELMTQSEGVGFAAYNSAWTNSFERHSRGLRCMICFLMLRSQKPLAVTCGKFVPMSRGLFLQVLYNSYTFFTLLRTINE